MFLDVLKYGFLVIFFSTAIIGIASIPNWIKIPEWYRKKIFLALILEVIGVLIIFFNQELITYNTKDIPHVSISDKKWAAVNKEGEFINPKVQVKTKDTLITKTLNDLSSLELNNLVLQIINGNLQLLSKDSVLIGTINSKDILNNGIFNSFKTAKNEITSSENYSYIKWTKKFKGNWRKRGTFINPFELKVKDYTEGTYYLIINTINNITVYDSRKSSKDLFSVDARKVHFFKHNNAYYLIRIAWVDLVHKNKYVHVINLRMEPNFM